MNNSRNGVMSRGRKRKIAKQDVEVVNTRILRSHKRKLTDVESKKEEKKNGKRPNLEIRTSNVSDCIILSDTSNTDVSSSSKKSVYTSTPIGKKTRRKPKFNVSSIKGTSENSKEKSVICEEVILLSESSGPTIELIHLSEEEKSNDEIEILPIVNKNKNPQNDNKKMTVGSVSLPTSKGSTKRCLKPKDKCKNIGENFSEKPKDVETENYPTETLIQTMKNYPLTLFGDNLYIEKPILQPRRGLRPVIIDGSNVAFHYSNNRYFSCRGLEICIEYFKQRGHQVIAFVPHFRVKNNKSDNPKLLDELAKKGDVVLTPSRVVDGNQIVSYDDRYIIQTAALKGGVVVSRDNYRDLLTENPAWGDTIKYRLLQFTWVHDILMFPSDPLGPNGPTLEEFLKFG